MARTRDWCKLDQRWYANKKVRKLTRKYGPVAGAYWTYLVARSYDESHYQDNPTGMFVTTLQDVSDDLYDEHPRVELWSGMIRFQLIRLNGLGWQSNQHADVRIELVDFASWQWAKGSPVKYQAVAREAAKVRDLQVSATIAQPLRNHSATQTETETETNYLTSSPTSTTACGPAPDDDDQSQSSVYPERTMLAPTADQEVEAVRTMTATLQRVTSENQAAAVAENLLIASRRPHPKSRMRHGLEQWVAAVQQFVVRVESEQGWRPQGDGTGYIIGMVPTAGASLTIDESRVVVKDDASGESEERARQLAELYANGGTEA